MELNNLNEIIKKVTKKVLNEYVIFPQYGYCLIIVGGPGSGKSYIRDTQIPINGKVFDLDDFTKKYKTINKGKDRKEIALHLKKSEDLFLHNQGNIKNNIIFDICGRPERNKPSLIEEIISMVKPLGYKIGICWVVCNRSVAIKRNMERDRVLPDESLHRRHNQVLNFLPQFITSNKTKNVDDVWITFSSGKNLSDTNYPKTVKLKKGEDGFILPDNILKTIYDISGPIEKIVKRQPTVYFNRSEIKKGKGDNISYLRNNINENIITESFTDIVYHFTTLNNLYNILATKKFILSSISNNKNDTYLNTKGYTVYPYYLSFTREHSVKRGYPATMNGMDVYGNNYDKYKKYNPGESLSVRITFDGKKLTTMYKGGPVNYHYRTNNNLKSQIINCPKDKTSIYRQSEDRLYSTKIEDSNLLKCITGIDIFYPYIDDNGNFTNKTPSTKIFSNVISLCKKENFNVKVYNNLKTFDYDLRGNHSIDISNMSNIIDISDINKEKKFTIKRIDCIAKLLSLILYNEDIQSINNYVDYLLNDYVQYKDYKNIKNSVIKEIINKINNIKETREIPKITTFLLKTLKDLNIKSKYDYIFNEMKKKYNINPEITRGGAFLKSFLKQGK